MFHYFMKTHTELFCKHTDRESQGYMEQNSPPLTPNQSLSELLTALTEHRHLQCSTLRFLFLIQLLNLYSLSLKKEVIIRQ